MDATSTITSGADLGPQIRLMICDTCSVIEELPDFEGNPDHDVTLNIAVQNHTDPSGIAHIGKLMKVPVKYWANAQVRDEIKKQLSAGGSKGLDEVDEKFYESRSTFHEDAMSCYAKHMRPKGRCPDYKIDSKRLVPNTKADRKEAGLGKAGTAGPKVFLCDFCPAKQYMVTRNRAEAGMYK